MLRIIDWEKNFEPLKGSRAVKGRLSWVRIPIKMDGAGYTALVDHENGAAHFGAWLAIVEIAGAQEIGKRGVLPRAPGSNPHDHHGIFQALASISRVRPAMFAEALPRLLYEIGWLEEFGVGKDELVAAPQAKLAMPPAALPATASQRTARARRTPLQDGACASGGDSNEGTDTFNE
jgi:hypothetical protein